MLLALHFQHVVEIRGPHPAAAPKVREAVADQLGKWRVFDAPHPERQAEAMFALVDDLLGQQVAQGYPLI